MKENLKNINPVENLDLAKELRSEKLTVLVSSVGMVSLSLHVLSLHLMRRYTVLFENFYKLFLFSIISI